MENVTIGSKSMFNDPEPDESKETRKAESIRAERISILATMERNLARVTADGDEEGIRVFTRICNTYRELIDGN